MSDSVTPMNYSLPGSSIHGILQARILEWLAISFSISTVDVLTYILANSVLGFSFFSHLSQQLLFIILLVTGFLTDVMWYLIFVSICTSLMISSAEHLFCYLKILIHTEHGPWSILLIQFKNNKKINILETEQPNSTKLTNFIEKDPTLYSKFYRVSK